MNIQDYVVEKGFVFELELDMHGFNCSVKGNGEEIELLTHFRLEVDWRGFPTLSIRGYKAGSDGKTNNPENSTEAVSFSRSFFVRPGESNGNRVVLIVESERELEEESGPLRSGKISRERW